MLYRIICSKEANTFKINVIVMESEAVRPHSTEFQMEVFSFRVSFYPIMETWNQMLDYYTTLNKISEPTHKPTHRHCVTHNWQKLTPEKKDVNVGNYMTVMKCIWGNLVVEIKSPRREKNVCVPLEPKWVR